ncbi:MAG: type II toxin-antitoxin system RelE/ParE family toxin [Hyphomonadaceae bacterium]
MKRLLWAAKARQDLRKIIRHFSAKDRRIADLLLERIERVARSLTKKDTGRPGRMPDLREKSVARTRYILAYRVRERDVIILRVIHSAQQWTKSTWPQA